MAGTQDLREINMDEYGGIETSGLLCALINQRVFPICAGCKKMLWHCARHVLVTGNGCIIFKLDNLVSCKSKLTG